MKNQTVAQATLDQDRANLDSAKASVLQNEAALTIAQENLGYTDIKAPIDGRIGLTAYTQGNLVNPVERRAGDDRQPGSDLCAISGERARARGHQSSAQAGERQP